MENLIHFLGGACPVVIIFLIYVLTRKFRVNSNYDEYSTIGIQSFTVVGINEVQTKNTHRPIVEYKLEGLYPVAKGECNRVVIYVHGERGWCNIGDKWNLSPEKIRST